MHILLNTLTVGDISTHWSSSHSTIPNYLLLWHIENSWWLLVSSCGGLSLIEWRQDWGICDRLYVRVSSLICVYKLINSHSCLMWNHCLHLLALLKALVVEIYRLDKRFLLEDPSCKLQVLIVNSCRFSLLHFIIQSAWVLWGGTLCDMEAKTLCRWGLTFKPSSFLQWVERIWD